VSSHTKLSGFAKSALTSNLQPDRVFRKTRHRVTVKGQVQGRFDAEELARAVREVVKQQGLQENALFKDKSITAYKVCVARYI
jgi:RecB family endonuclease NucS